MDFEEALEIDEPDFHLTLKFANQFTDCYLSVNPKTACETETVSETAPAIQLTRELLENILQTHKITVGVLEEALAMVCAECQKGRAITDVLIAQGTLPEPGRDASLEFSIKPFSSEPNFDEDTKGHIDFHEAHLFENAKTGQLIAVGHAAIPSRNGQTVTGKIIPTPMLHIHPTRVGPGVELVPETLHYLAKINGRVIYKENTLSVTEEFFVDEDVDYRTGHIHFVGFVTVRGDVLDGFDVYGKKGVKVYGSVGNCRIESEGDIDLGCMNGRDTHAQIRCGGNLKVGCLCNTQVECLGNVYVRKEACHSTIYAKGAVHVGGRIVGGSCVALAGIEAAVVGSDVGVKTFLRAGIEFQLIQTVDAFWARLKPIQKRLQNLRDQLDQAGHPPEQPASAEQQKQTANLKAEIQKTESQRDELMEKINWIQAHTANLANSKINFTQMLNSSTMIHLGQTEMEVTQPCEGPHSITEGTGTELCISSLTPLAQKFFRTASE